MNSIEGQPILTAAGMRAAEAGSIAPGATIEMLMARAVAPLATAGSIPIFVDGLFGTGLPRAGCRNRRRARPAAFVHTPDARPWAGEARAWASIRYGGLWCGAADRHRRTDRQRCDGPRRAEAGAAALATTAAARGGAGYLLLGSMTGGLPHAIVRRRYTAVALDDRRIGAVVVGPGLGSDDHARARLNDALASLHPLAIDGDVLGLFNADRLAERHAATILIPHAGEFDAMFGSDIGGRIDRARTAAARTGATVILKGVDTVIIASPEGGVRATIDVPAWLSTAGTGDVLARLVAARLAGGTATFVAIASCH